MLRLLEVASQSVTFSTRVLENHESKIFAWMAQPGHYRPVFSIDRPPLLAVSMSVNSSLNRPRLKTSTVCCERHRSTNASRILFPDRSFTCNQHSEIGGS